MKPKDFEITLANDSNREFEFAEIWCADELCAEISQENTEHLLTLFPRQNKMTWRLPFEGFLKAAKSGEKSLQKLNEEADLFIPLLEDPKEDPLNLDTSKWMLKSVSINFDVAMQHLKQYLIDKNNLSMGVLENVDFKGGHFFVLFPEMLSDDLASQLSHKHILPTLEQAHLESKNFLASYSEWMNWIKNPTIKLIRRWMIERKESFLCESINKDFRGINSDFQKSASFYFGEEVYYRIQYPKNDWWMLRESFYWAHLSSHFVGVLFKEEEGLFKGNHIQDGAFERIAKNASLVLIGAYNGDGYIFWQKDPFDLHSIGIPVANHKGL